MASTCLVSVSMSRTWSIWAMLIMHLSENASALGEIPEPSTRSVQPSAMARLMSLTTSSSFSGSYTRLQAQQIGDRRWLGGFKGGHNGIGLLYSAERACPLLAQVARTVWSELRGIELWLAY